MSKPVGSITQRREPIRRIQLFSFVPDDWLYRLIGRKIGEHHIEHYIGGQDVDVLKPDGSLLLKYRVNALAADVVSRALPALRRAARSTHNRLTASGGEDSVRSGIAGFVDPFGYSPYCRMTAFTRDDVDGWASLNGFLLANDAVLRCECPKHYATRWRVASLIHPYWRITGTVFTTLTVNLNYRSALHRDNGNLGLSVLSVSRTGRYSGGLLVFPKWCVGVDLRDRDVLIADLTEYHGNSAMEGRNAFERLSTVLYFRAGIVNCGTPVEEMEKARRLTR